MSIRTLSNAHIIRETYADNDFTIEELESVTYYEGGLATIRISGNCTGITVANHDGNLHALLGERVVVVWRNTVQAEAIEAIGAIRFSGQDQICIPQV